MGMLPGLVAALALTAAAAPPYFSSPPPASPLSPAGLWKAVDAGRGGGLIRIFERNGLFFGRIEKNLDPRPGRPTTCKACRDDRKDQPIEGLVILRNMKRQADGEYRDGDILDPDSGFVYRCKFRVTEDGSKLLLRGYLGISLLGRTTTWMRQSD
jgi:hypothetical protein